MLTLKNGLFYENGELIYYEKGFPCHAGVIRVEDSIYYISYEGKAVRGQCIVHRDMANGILKRGTYTFGKDYKLVPGSYRAPHMFKKRKRAKTIKTSEDRSLKHIWRYLVENGHHKKIAATLVTLVLIVGLVLVVSWSERFNVPGKMASTVQTNEATENQTEQNAVAEKETRPQQETTPEKETMPEQETTSGKVMVVLPQYKEDVLLCSQTAKMEYDGEITIKDAIKGGDPYRPFVFEYTFENSSGTLWLGEKADLSDAKQYELPKHQQKVEIHNLKVDTDYYYKVLVAGQEYLGNFHTAQSTRYLHISGLENTRDIGGGITQDGKKVKQGLLIRGPEMDGLTTEECFVPEEQVAAVKQEFGFMYDMDLRSSQIYISEYYSKLGIPQNFYYAPRYGQIFNKGYSKALKRVFQDLAKPENYPVYMHCSWGRDRTGTMVFLLQAVLNMSEEDMWQEFRRSAYSHSKMAINEDMQVVVAGLEPYEGDTLQEKIITFLTTEIGVTYEELESIRSILLE